MDLDSLFLKRKRANVSQRDLAKRLGIAIWTVVDIEKGRIEVTEAYLERMAGAIDDHVLAISRENKRKGLDLGVQ